MGGYVLKLILQFFVEKAKKEEMCMIKNFSKIRTKNSEVSIISGLSR